MALRIRDHLFGALAQLGERNAGSVEVTGSIPVGATTITCFIGYPNLDNRAQETLYIVVSVYQSYMDCSTSRASGLSNQAFGP